MKSRKRRQKSELSLRAAAKLLGRTSAPRRAPERLTTVAAELSAVLNPPADTSRAGSGPRRAQQRADRAAWQRRVRRRLLRRF